MISEAKLREIDRSPVWSTWEKEQMAKALREAAKIIEKFNELQIWYPSAHEWLREWRGESDKQGEAHDAD